jgi:predicted phosphodiesterase
MQSGLAAGAGTLALGEPIVADQDDEHYLIGSDFHWGSPFASNTKSVQFLEEEVPEQDPDVLVLAGDIYEMWWRGMVSSALDAGGASDWLEQLYENGTDVALVAGNHDRWMLRVGQDASEEIAPGKPWEIGEEFYFESGGQEFVAVHGDGADPIQRDPLSEWLCQQTDEFGTFLLALLELISGLGVVGEMGSMTVQSEGWQSVSLSHQYEDPVVVTAPVAGTATLRPRVRTATGLAEATSFELRLDSRTGDAPELETVDYLVFERGRHMVETDTAVTVDRVSAGSDWQTVTFEGPFEEPPAVFTTLQTVGGPPTYGHAGRDSTRRRRASPDRGLLDDDASVGGGRPGVVSGPIAVQVRNVTEMGFEMRLASNGKTLPHDVGFVAIERGTASFGDGLVEAGVVEPSGGETPLEFGALPGEPDHVFAGTQSSDGASGPAFVERSAGSKAAVSVVSEDGTPRSETVGYLAAAGVGPISASSSTAIEQDPDAVLQQEWEKLLDSEQVVSAGDTPQATPTAGLLDPLSVSQQGTTDNLLDMFEEFVVFGHTHRPDLGERHVNSGSWTSRSPSSVPQNTYVEIDAGDVTVWNWSPDGREPLYES